MPSCRDHDACSMPARAACVKADRYVIHVIFDRRVRLWLGVLAPVVSGALLCAGAAV